MSAKYLLYISSGGNPIVTTNTDEAKAKIKAIYNFGTKAFPTDDQEVHLILQEINKNDFATLDSKLKPKYTSTIIRFHFIISKTFISHDYQQKVIGTLISCLMLNKVKNEFCNFKSTVYLGQDRSAKNFLDPLYPLGKKFLIDYTNFLTDDK